MWRMRLAGALGAENVSNILISTKDGSKMAARDEIHAHITCTDADSNNTAQMDDLAYSLRSLTLGLLPLHRRLPA